MRVAPSLSRSLRQGGEVDFLRQVFTAGAQVFDCLSYHGKGCPIFAVFAKVGTSDDCGNG